MILKISARAGAEIASAATAASAAKATRLQATTLVVASDIEILVKSSRGQVLGTVLALPNAAHPYGFTRLAPLERHEEIAVREGQHVLLVLPRVRGGNRVLQLS